MSESRMPSRDNGSKQKDLPPGQTAVRHILRWGEDHPTIQGSVPHINLDRWTLSLEGEVKRPLRIGWDKLLELPRVESTCDFHCVEGWSVQNLEWEGVAFQTIVDLVEPAETARSATFECADGYTTSLSLRELLAKTAFLAYKVDGEFLEPEIGGPLRLIVHEKYAYKSAMWVTKVEFLSTKELGYWEKRGYSDTADVWKNDRFSK